MSERLRIKSRLKDYTVEFTDDFADSIKTRMKDGAFLIIDEKVNKLFGKRVRKFFPTSCIISIQATERNKTLEYCNKLMKELIKKNIRRDKVLFAVGGGVIEDITGFISTILFRGIDWVFCPTTLLAQADSCIGSKSSINLGGYKNLVGSFCPPSVIFIDVAFLKTLPVDEIKSGIGEILHFYFIAGEDKLAQKLTDNYEMLLRSPGMLKCYILPSLKIKKKIVEIDELDTNERNIFNYGHTFGHAIEAVTGYAVNHGQAVTMGMDIANYISLRLRYIDENMFRDMHRSLSKNLPRFRLQKEKLGDYCRALSRDKKNIGNMLGCILTHGLGLMKKVHLPMDKELRGVLMDYFRKEFR